MLVLIDFILYWTDHGFLQKAWLLIEYWFDIAWATYNTHSDLCELFMAFLRLIFQVVFIYWLYLKHTWVIQDESF